MHWSYDDLRDNPARVLRGLAEFFERLPDRTSNVEVLLAKLNRWKLETATVVSLIWPWISDRSEAQLRLDWMEADRYPSKYPEVPGFDASGYDCCELPVHENWPWYIQQFFLCDRFCFPPGFGLLGSVTPTLSQVVNHCTNLCQLLNDIADQVDSIDRPPLALLDALCKQPTEPATIAAIDPQSADGTHAKPETDADFLAIPPYDPNDPDIESIGRPAHAMAEEGLGWIPIAVQMGLRPDQDDYVRKWAIVWGAVHDQRLRRRKRGRPKPQRRPTTNGQEEE